MLKKTLKGLLWLLLILLLLVLGVLAYGLGSERGLQQILAVAKQQAPGQLQVAQSSGSLLGPLDMSGFNYQQDDGLAVSVGSLALRWQPSALFSRKLQLDRLALHDVELHLPPPAEDVPKQEGPVSLPDIHLPLAIRVGELDLRNIRIYPYSESGESKPIVIESVRLEAGAEDDTLQVVELHAEAPEGEVTLSGTVQPTGDYPLDLTLDWRFEHAQFGRFTGEGSIGGDLANMQLVHRVAGPVQVDLKADLLQVLVSPAWDASVQITADDLGVFSPQLKAAPLQMKLLSKGSLEAFSASGKATTALAQTGPLQLDFSARGNPEHIDLEATRIKLLQQPAELSVAGGIDLQPLVLDIKGGWQALQWPLQAGEASAAPQFASHKGAFTLQGPLDDYRFSLDADASGEAIPAGQWSLDGAGSQEALKRFGLKGRLLDGELAVTGKARWSPQPVWDVEVTGSGINPGVKWQDFPAKLATKLTSQGKVVDGEVSLVADIQQLDGDFRGYPVDGRGQVRVQGKAVDIKNLRLRSGDTLLQADGHIDQTLAVEWSLNAPDLATLAPGFKGAVESRGTLSGTQQAPAVDMQLSVRKLDVAGTQLESLQGTAKVDISGASRSKVDFRGRDLLLGGKKWSSLTLQGEGTPEQHALELTLNGELAELASRLAGGWKNAQWQGELSRLDALKTPLGDWGLKAPAALSLSPEKARAEQLCLQSQPTELCVDGHWSASVGAQGTLKLAGLDPARFKEYLPPGMTLETTLEGEASGRRDAAGNIDAKADFRLRAGRLKVASEISPLDMPLGESRVQARVKGDSIETVTSLDLGEVGTVDVAAIINGLLNKGLDAAQLDATLKADLHNLDVVGKLVPDLEEVQGKLTADLQAVGAMLEPAVLGELRLEDFAAEVPAVALKIEDTQLLAKSSGKGPLLIEGSSHSGEGALELSGELDPKSRALKLLLKGENFQVANSDKLRAVITPDMRITMNSQGMSVDGSLTIPSAYINAGGSSEEGTTLAPSKDLVLVDEKGVVTKKAQGSNMNINLRIELGEDIKVEAPGFSGALKGSLLVEQTPQLAPRGTGTIEIVNGDYVVYGQKLTMQRGRILFSGGPVDNPKLDLDVARRVEAYDVLAGAKIRGTAQAPQLTLYSEPAMPDASILSFMLLGQPPGTKGGSYTLGKYITPDLYVSYGIGLFDAANSFNMRYKLTDKLAVQAASGLASSADLIYTFER